MRFFFNFFTLIAVVMLSSCSFVSLNAIKDALVEVKNVELKGIGNIVFSCSGALTKTAIGD